MTILSALFSTSLLIKSAELYIEEHILYNYQKTRSGSCAEEFLEGFSGYLQTYGYDGYNKVKNIKRLYCMAHIRRKFFDIISTLNPEALKQSHALEGFNYYEQLYEVEKDLKKFLLILLHYNMAYLPL
jgi:hypothetical protein